MNKKLFLVPVLLVVASCAQVRGSSMVSSSEISESSIIPYEESNQSNMMLFPTCSAGAGCIGDPMPFYENGKMNIFYLEDARNYRLGFHPVSLLTTTDFMTYEDLGIVIPYVDDRKDPDLAIGTGSCVKDKDGLYHFFYTGHNGNSPERSGLPYYEKIQHATSTDLINWTKIPEDGFFGDSNDFRDPHVVYIEEKNEYWMLVTTNVNGVGIFRRYISTDLKHWTDTGSYFTNNFGGYNMECPTLIHYKGYWYLSFSEQGSHRVTHYRYKKNLDDPWITPSVDYFDDEGFYAGKITGDEDRLFIYGWCGTKQRSKDTGTLDWAGNLVGHELYQKENGELLVKPIYEISQTLSHPFTQLTYSTQEEKKELSFDGNGFKSIAFNEFKKDRITRISFDYTPRSNSGNAGLTFNVQSDNSMGSLALSFDNLTQRVSFYNNVLTSQIMNLPNYKMPYNFAINQKVHMDLFYEGTVVSLYINNEKALTQRMYKSYNAKFAFYSNNCQSDFENIVFYE